MGALGGLLERLGNFADLAAAVAAGRIEKGLHGDEVDDAFKTFAVHDGQLDGDALAAEALAEGG